MNDKDRLLGDIMVTVPDDGTLLEAKGAEKL